VLVLGPGHVVLSVHVSPVDVGGDVLSLVEVPSVGGEFDLGATEIGNLNTAASLGLGEEVLRDVALGCEGLGEVVDGVVIEDRVLLSIGGDMSNTLGPGVLGGSPSAVGLDGDVVDTTTDAEETTLTPVGTPGVTDSPELLAFFGDTVADNGNVVDNGLITRVVTVDTTGVVLERFGHGDTASDGATLVDLLHHGFLTGNGTELLSLVDVVGVGNEAGLTGVAVSAVGHGGADTTVVEATSSVDGAGLVRDLVVGHPLVGEDGITTVTSEGVVLTVDKNLGSDVDVGPGGVSGDLDSVTEGGSGSVSPAGTTVLGDVLVTDVGEEVSSVDVVPDPLLGKVVDGLELRLDLVLNGFGEGDTAGVVLGDESLSSSSEASDGGDGE